MEYFLIWEHNRIVRETNDGFQAFMPYTGEYSTKDDSLYQIGHARMTVISDEKAETFIKAAAIARKAHAGQKDKGGEDYFNHPCRVVENVFCDSGNADDVVDAMTAAILHDVVEDTDVSLNDLKAAGLPENVIEAVDVLTKRNEDDYFDYIRKVKENKIAKTVKLADLWDNMNISRIKHPKKKDYERYEKYAKARELLND